MSGTKPRGKALPLTSEMVVAITTMLQAGKNQTDLRDLAILRVGIDTMLRVSDITQILIGHVSDNYGRIADEFVIGQKKTKGKAVTCCLSKTTKDVLEQYIKTLPVADRRAKLFPITTRQVQRIVKKMMSMIRVDGTRFSPHSMRRTKASIIYNSTKNIEAVRKLLGHSSVSATSEYLDVSMNDALDLARSVNI